jgi:hypothetical protein
MAEDRVFIFQLLFFVCFLCIGEPGMIKPIGFVLDGCGSLSNECRTNTNVVLLKRMRAWAVAYSRC